ncbi:MAG: hypothetical protein RDA78_06110 [Roseibium sp.]
MLFKPRQHTGQGGKARPVAFCDRFGRVFDLLVDPGDVALQPGAFLALAVIGRSQTLIDCLGQGRKVGDGKHGGRERLQHPLFEGLAFDAPAVCTAELLLVVGAAISVFGHNGVRAATFGAFKPPAQEMARALHGVQGIALFGIVTGSDLGLPVLDPVPQVVRDYLKLLELVMRPLLLAVHAGLAGLGVRIF